MFVKINRSVVKRWGVLFICMATRACHIEVVPDLTTNSFVQCFWRFTCRRGLYCRSLFTDRGSNFIGCDYEFKKIRKRCSMTEPPAIGDDEWQQVNTDLVSQCMLRKGVDVQWHFNTAKTTHAGGSWEQAIQTVKYVMRAILYNGMAGLPALKTRVPTDFELLSILCEVEAVINCRPITKLTSDVADW